MLYGSFRRSLDSLVALLWTPSISFMSPELSSDFIYPKIGSNWRTVVINANSITHKKAEISAMADYCDSDLMLITETKLDSSIFSSELLPKGYVGEFRRDCNLNGGEVMIVTKDCYTITDRLQNETELVWATITLKDKPQNYSHFGL